MSTSAEELLSVTAMSVDVTEDTVSVELSDGRTIAAPVCWFPLLSHATSAERQNWRLGGPGHGVHWPDLDEDISVSGLLLGRPSGESQASLRRWLDQRKQSKKSGGAGIRRKK